MFNIVDKLNDEATNSEKYYCNDFICKFAGTGYCIKDSCNNCRLHDCRGCNHFEECIEEGLLN